MGFENLEEIKIMGYSTGIELSKRGNRGEVTLEQAIAKTYIVKASGKRSQHIALPSSLFGKRVKLVLVGGEE